MQNTGMLEDVKKNRNQECEPAASIPFLSQKKERKKENISPSIEQASNKH